MILTQQTHCTVRFTKQSADSINLYWFLVVFSHSGKHQNVSWHVEPNIVHFLFIITIDVYFNWSNQLWQLIKAISASIKRWNQWMNADLVWLHCTGKENNNFSNVILSDLLYSAEHFCNKFPFGLLNHIKLHFPSTHHSYSSSYCLFHLSNPNYHLSGLE